METESRSRVTAIEELLDEALILLLPFRPEGGCDLVEVMELAGMSPKLNNMFKRYPTDLSCRIGGVISGGEVTSVCDEFSLMDKKCGSSPCSKSVSGVAILNVGDTGRLEARHLEGSKWLAEETM